MAASFRAHGVDLTDDDLRLFLRAAYDVWSSHHSLAASTHAMLEALRRRGLKVAIVSNTASPEWLLRPLVDRLAA
jgi:FMN phosphatase YigB (HAD superfamily)